MSNFLLISIILSLIPIEIPKKYKIEAPCVHQREIPFTVNMIKQHGASLEKI
jgi:hypothetical protein